MRPPGRNRPRAIRTQTTAKPSVDDPFWEPRPSGDDRCKPSADGRSGPSACRRPPGHPHADALQAIPMQTTDTCERGCMNAHGLRRVSTPRSPSDAHTEYLRVQIGSLCQANHLPGGSFLGGLGRHLHQLTPLKRDAGVHSESAECICFPHSVRDGKRPIRRQQSRGGGDRHCCSWETVGAAVIVVTGAVDATGSARVTYSTTGARRAGCPHSTTAGGAFVVPTVFTTTCTCGTSTTNTTRTSTTLWMYCNCGIHTVFDTSGPWGSASATRQGCRQFVDELQLPNLKRSSTQSIPWAPVVAQQKPNQQLVQDLHLLELHGLPHRLPCGCMPQSANHALHTILDNNKKSFHDGSRDERGRRKFTGRGAPKLSLRRDDLVNARATVQVAKQAGLCSRYADDQWAIRGRPGRRAAIAAILMYNGTSPPSGFRSSSPAIHR